MSQIFEVNILAFVTETECLYRFCCEWDDSVFVFTFRTVAHLGSGEFGTVDKGLWTSGSGALDVAVKTLTDAANIVKFLQEAAIMAQFKHPNVIALRGVVSNGMPVSIYRLHL